jgi:hypothetical protein
MKRCLVLAFLLSSPIPTVAASEVPVLVELFTSEGCSSCPPADALLARLAGERLADARVVALSEHVDTWDDLGWKDRFSSPLFTRRQQAYARRMRLSAVYTPQLVVSGRFEALGSDASAARAAIGAGARAAAGRIEARLVQGGRGAPELAVEAEWASGVPAQVLVALVQDRAQSRVERGENAGRILSHAAVVRSLSVVGEGAGTFRGRAELRAPEAAEADRAVVFVQEREGGPVHAVAAVALR